MKKVAIVLLNWNGKNWLEKFIPSILEHTSHPDVELVVVDNNSTDDSLSYLSMHYPSVRQIKFSQNHGFAQGYNKALMNNLVDATYFVLLNTDVEVTPNWLSPLLDFMDENPHVAAAQPKVRSYHQPEKFEYAGAAGGFVDSYGYPYCRGRILQSTEVDRGQYDTPIPIFWATGACMIVRPQSFKQVGGFDEEFFAHMEEIDLCWRLWRSGHQVYCVPRSTVFHVGGGTLSTQSPYKVYLNFRNNLLMIHKNASRAQRNKILFIRGVLDTMAQILFLIQGEWAKAKAVWQARRDFAKMKKKYSSNVIETTSIQSSLPYPFKGSILWNYYIRRRKKFSDLIK